jgi:hypothetical protein
MADGCLLVATSNVSDGCKTCNCTSMCVCMYVCACAHVHRHVYGVGVRTCVLVHVHLYVLVVVHSLLHLCYKELRFWLTGYRDTCM